MSKSTIDCDLCCKPLNPETKVCLRTTTTIYNKTCRSCILAVNNREELEVLEKARRDFQNARVKYHQSPHDKGNFVPFYRDVVTVMVYPDSIDYSFQD